MSKAGRLASVSFSVIFGRRLRRNGIRREIKKSLFCTLLARPVRQVSPGRSWGKACEMVALISSKAPGRRQGGRRQPLLGRKFTPPSEVGRNWPFCHFRPPGLGNGGRAPFSIEKSKKKVTLFSRDIFQGRNDQGRNFDQILGRNWISPRGVGGGGRHLATGWVAWLRGNQGLYHIHFSIARGLGLFV